MSRGDTVTLASTLAELAWEAELRPLLVLGRPLPPRRCDCGRDVDLVATHDPDRALWLVDGVCDCGRAHGLEVYGLSIPAEELEEFRYQLATGALPIRPNPDVVDRERFQAEADAAWSEAVDGLLGRGPAAPAIAERYRKMTEEFGQLRHVTKADLE